MTGNDDDKGVVNKGMGDRAHRAWSSKLGGDLVIGAGFAVGNPLDQPIDALIKNGNAAHIEHDIGEVGRAFGKLADKPNLNAWVERLHARPAYKRALEKGGIVKGLRVASDATIKALS